MIVRRTRLVGPQAELWPDWRHFPFLTNRSEDITRRGRAPPARRGRAHDPRPQRPSARALPLRTVQRQQRLDCDRRHCAQPHPLDHGDRPARHTIRAARTLRRRLLQIPGRLTRTARQWTLHLPARRRRGRPTSSMRLPASGRFPRPPEQDPTPRRRYEHRAAPSRHRCAKTRPIALKAQRDPSHQQTRSQTSTAGRPTPLEPAEINARHQPIGGSRLSGLGHWSAATCSTSTSASRVQRPAAWRRETATRSTTTSRGP